MKTMFAAASFAALSSPAFASIPIGRGEVTPSITATATYDSNVFGVRDATDDYSATVRPGVSYIRQAALIEASASFGVSVIRYDEQTQLNQENLDAIFALTLPDSDIRNYSGSASAAYLESSDLDTDLNARVQKQTTTIATRAALASGPRTDVSASINHTDTERSVASNQKTLGTQVAYGYKDFFYGNTLHLAANYDQLESSGENDRGVALDQSSYLFTAGLSRAFAREALRARASYGYRILNRSAAETDAGVKRQSGSVISAGLDGPFLPKKYFPKIESRFGIAYQNSATPGINDTGSEEFTGFISLAWQARSTTDVTFGVTRSQRLSANDLSIVSTNVRLGLNQALRTNLEGSLYVSHDWSSYSTVDREDKTISAGGSLNYRFARSWDAALSHSFSTTDSGISESTYDRHLTNLSLTYRF